MELPKNLGLIKLPPHLEIAVYLIKAELKNKKFVSTLEQVGLDPALCSVDFSSLILKLIGFESNSDKVFDFYSRLLESSTNDFDLREGEELLNKAAFKFYLELEMEKKKLKE
jgi:hypothetical protein